MEVFKVGDKVSRNGTACIGTVIKITEKRKDVVVDFGNFKETYNLHGSQKGADVWTSSHIYLLTPELQQEIKDARMVRKCKDLLDEAKDNLTADKARKIIKFLLELQPKEKEDEQDECVD